MFSRHSIPTSGQKNRSLHIKMSTKMIHLTIFLFLFSISSVEMMTLKQHTLELEHQEELFSKLINTTPPYNVRLSPYSPQGPVRVNTSIYVYSMTSIDDLHTDYSMQILYRQTWYDKRLTFEPDATVQKIVGNNWHSQHIWTPSIHAVNDKDIGSFAGDGDGTVLLHIRPDGSVLLLKRVKLRPFCNMKFHRYPMDKQQCTLEIQSSLLPSSELELAWAEEKALDLNERFFPTGFSLINYTLEQSISTYWHTGNFSRITVRFDLQREFGHFLLDTYIPSILFVVTSWLSFWVEIPAAPARVTLGMTTMLTLVTSERAIREKLPKVSYVHALDIWNVVCTGFIFASLVQYALVNYIYHKDKRRRKNASGMKRVESTATFCSLDSEAGSTFRIFSKKRENQHGGMPNKKAASFASLADAQSVNMDASCGWPLDQFKMTPQDIANSIDRKCRFIFPAGFLVFNIFYWLVLWL